MLKKLLIAVVAVAVGLTVVRSTKLGSLMRVKWHDAAAWCNKQIPVEDEIARLRLEITRLGNDSKTHYSAVAEEMVKLDNLKHEISEGEAKLAQQKKKVTALRDALNEGGNKLVVLGEEKYPRVRVEKQLARDFDYYKAFEAQLASKRKVLENREAALAKAREQLTAMQESRRDLEVEVSRLEAEYNAVKVAQTKSKFSLDDSELSKIKAGVAALRDRIKVASTEAALQAEFVDGPIPVGDTVKTKDLLKEIDQHFNKDEGKVAVK
jgi:chromosome segregation ATPase